MAEQFNQLAGQGATLLKLELREQGGLLNRLAVDQLKAIVDGLEERLLACLPEGSSICRNRVDRLIALIPSHHSLPDLRREAEAWQRALSMPMLLGDIALTPVLSLGLSRAPQDGQRFELLLDSCDQALARAHRQPTASACVAAPPERPQRQLRLLAAPLALAIDQEKLRLAYQPIVELASQRVEGVEVLCRWNDPIHGRISPVDFIAVAEATEQINLLGSWLIDTVFAQLRRWLAIPLGLQYVSLNVSPLQLHHEGLVEVLQSGLERHGLEPGQIMLEITEDQNLGSRSRARAHLLQLQRLGFTLAMDDYGTGYSGLHRLQTLPFGAVKVDRCLINAIETDRLQQAMLRGVVDLQNNTDLRVVVEGVERESQRSTLLDLGCRMGQGFLFSRPIPADQLESLLRYA
jgi:EAL domain-containing protein (putative c-di-GMP-specific phosphodiesterase class I)